VLGLILKGYSKRADMAAKVNKTVVTVARAIDALVKLGIVERETVKGKPSKLRISTRIMDAVRVLEADAATRITNATSDTGDTTTRIINDTTQITRITNDPTTRISGDPTAPNDTGQAGDNPPRADIGTGARAETLNLNTRATDQIRSDRTATKAEIDALIRRAGEGCDPTAPGVHHGADLNRLLRGGCDWALDIEPAVDKLSASFLRRGKRFSTWALLEEHAIEFRDRRLAGLPAPVAPSAIAARDARPRRNGPYGANGIAPMVACG
jgi:hypothetical protein